MKPISSEISHKALLDCHFRGTVPDIIESRTNDPQSQIAQARSVLECLADVMRFYRCEQVLWQELAVLSTAISSIP